MNIFDNFSEKKCICWILSAHFEPKIKIHDIHKSPLVRSNHGIEHPEQGYTRGEDRVSSELRMKNALNFEISK